MEKWLLKHLNKEFFEKFFDCWCNVMAILVILLGLFIVVFKVWQWLTA